MPLGWRNMDKEQRRIIRQQVREAIEAGQTTPEELVLLLEITVEEMCKQFPHKLIEHAEKFGVYPPEEGEGWEKEMEEN